MWRSPRAGSCSCFMHSPVWIIWLFFQTETAETRPARSRRSAWVWLLRPTTNDKPARACKHRDCARYLGDVDVVGVMLGGRDHERDALVQLDACQRRDPHVEEDAKEHGQRDEPEHVRHHYGHTCGRGGEARKEVKGETLRTRAEANTPLTPLIWNMFPAQLRWLRRDSG